jgi:DNA modification methylase
VRYYLEDFHLSPDDTLLDPFCGTGTTIVEARLNGFRSIGVEANPFAHFATSVKIDWSVDPSDFAAAAGKTATRAQSILASQGIDDTSEEDGRIAPDALRSLPPEAGRLLIDDSVSPVPLHKALVLLECIRALDREPFYPHALLAFADALVFSISNLRFGPEVGVGRRKPNTPVIQPWLDRVFRICRDIRSLPTNTYPPAEARLADARQIAAVLQPREIHAVITSPPYPNEKDYTRTTRLESVVLGFINSRQELRDFKMTLVRSNTRGVYKDDTDDQWVAGHPSIQAIASAIEERRKELGKTSGFERLYPRVTRLYFGGMARHLAQMREVLRPGARLAYVVGDQASYLRIMIPTGRLLADIAKDLGYKPIRIDLFRKRFSTATREYLREEVVILEWQP